MYKGIEEQWQKGPWGILQDLPCWFFSSEQQGRRIMAPSPESFTAHDRFFSKGSPVPFIAPLILWCSAGFSSLFPSFFKLPGSRGNRHVRRVECLFLETPWILGEAALQRASLPSSSACSLFSMKSWAGAGRAAAASSARRSHAAGAVTTVWGEEGEGYSAVWTRFPSFDFELTSRLLSAQHLYNQLPWPLQKSKQLQSIPKGANFLSLPSCNYSFLVPNFLKHTLWLNLFVSLT